MKKNSGLKIHDGIFNTDRKSDIFGIFVLVCLCSSVMLTLSEAFVSSKGVFIALAAVCSVVSVIFIKIMDTKYAEVFPISFMGISGIYTLIFFGKIKDGMYVLSNDFLSWLSTVDGKIHLENAVENGGGVWFVGILIALLTGFFAAESIKRKTFVSVMPVIIAVVLGEIAGFVPMKIFAALNFVSMIVFAAYIIQAKADDSHFGKRLPVQLAAVVMCVLISMSSLAFPESMFEKSIVDGIIESRHPEKYHLSTPSMPEGMLKNLDAWEKSPTAALRLSMEYPQKMYLKGMVGEVYTGKGWEELDNVTKAEYEDVFYWLYKYGFYPHTSVSLATGISDSEAKKYSMDITNITACKENLYVPYALVGEDISDYTIIGGSHVSTSEDMGTVRYSYYAGSVPEWYMTQNALAGIQDEEKIKEYLRHEESYRDYVYKNYLQLTNASIGVMDRVLGTEKKQRTLAEIRKSIFDTLEEHLQYDESVVTKSGENDFFKYFMEQTKSGYSVHYATAAVLMLRYYGGPARYVEGYFLSGTEAEKYEPEQTIVLTEEHAHAWAEYYLDGIGWIPFEVTPGYVDDEELKLSNQVVSNQQVYDKNSLKYTPPLKQEDRTPLSNWRDLFEIKKEHIIALILLIILAFVLRALIKRRKLRRTLNGIKGYDNKEAITVMYGYCMMLIGKINDVDFAVNDLIREINLEARFSAGSMSDEQRRAVGEYLKEIYLLCREKWSFAEKIRYRFIECIYL